MNMVVVGSLGFLFGLYILFWVLGKTKRREKSHLSDRKLFTIISCIPAKIPQTHTHTHPKLKRMCSLCPSPQNQGENLNIHTKLAVMRQQSTKVQDLKNLESHTTILKMSRFLFKISHQTTN